jgi:ABC-type branched-subunit amino acid transport system substrate-binding protein
VTWLSPNQNELAEVGAHYARRARQVRQVAVVDNSSPTSLAAAKSFAARFRELGGKVNFEGEWQGTDWGLTRTVKALAANWPQVVFYAGDGKEAGMLVKAMHGEASLKNSVILGLPSLFHPDFINVARVDAKHSTAIFPCPDYSSSLKVSRYLGIGFDRKSPNYRSYVHYSYRKPGRWTSMIFDATQLLVESVQGAVLEKPAATAPADVLEETEAVLVNALPSREAVRQALNAVQGYRGIRGRIKFSKAREPLEPKAMIFNALNLVNTREMHWYDFNYGPPF